MTPPLCTQLTHPEEETLVIDREPSVSPHDIEPENDLHSLDDLFTGETSRLPWQRYEVLEDWPDQVLRSETVEAQGVLKWWVRPSVWYAPLRGPFMFKLVAGDFAVKTRVRVDVGEHFANRLGSLAGLMIRVPAEGGRPQWQRQHDNYVVHASGIASGISGYEPAIEITTTTKGHSGLETYRSKADWVELCLARLGALVLTLHRFAGGEWTFTQLEPQHRWGSHDYQGTGHLIRADLPHEVQVGLMAMADWESILRHQGLGFQNEYFQEPHTFNASLKAPMAAAVQASFGGVQFRRLTLPQMWHTLNLAVDVPPNELRALVLGPWASSPEVHQAHPQAEAHCLPFQ
ncbi:hypothetical protein [Deinococcus aquatilis]|uniref:hypothetical protein n=1 Tax=Deinococcus aquatilis TaxID=519440 RepID=UPI000375F5E3|nr:hypothetical protein [Deinococcus aquatilis]